MNDQQMRAYVANLYGPRWKKRILKMSDGQVLAIYRKHQAKLEKEKLESKQPKTEDNPDIPF